VEFDPGRSDLLPAEQATLTRLAEQIAQRRDLTLSVEGRFDPAADTEALKRAKLEKSIESRRDTAAAAAAAAGGSTLETILETLFAEQFSAEALQTERQRFTSAPPAAETSPAPPPASPAPAGSQSAAVPDAAAVPAQGTLDAARFYESLRAKLLEAQSVSQEELSALGTARAASIVAALTGSGTVDASRVTSEKPVPVKRKKNGSNRIAAEMTMSADPVAEKSQTNSN